MSQNTHNTAYLHQLCNYGKHIIKIKVHSASWGAIGIADEKQCKYENANFSKIKGAMSYYFGGYKYIDGLNFNRRKYGSKCNNGDIITMILEYDEYKGKLSFIKNDKDFGIAYDNINKSTLYRVALYQYYSNTKYTVLSYHIKQ